MGVNMKWIITLLAAVTLLSCKTIQPSSSSTTQTPIYVPPQESEIEEQEEKTTPDTPEVIEEEKQEEKTETITDKSSYNVAVILPFTIDKVPLDYTPYILDTNIYLSPENEDAINLYMGIKYAVDNFKNKEKKINVFVLDDASSEYQTRKVLSERPFPDVDVIVSGTTKKISPELIKYINQENIPTFAPYISNTLANSELLHIATPTSIHMIQRLLTELKNLYPEADVYIAQDKQDYTARLESKAISTFLESNFNLQTKAFKIIENDSLVDQQDIDFASDILWIASENETTVKEHLKYIGHSPKQIRVIGYPSWAKIRNIEKHIPDNVRVFIPEISLKENSNSIEELLAEKYQIEINDNILLAYDLMEYILSGIDQKVIHKHPTSEDANHQPNQYYFDFIPVTNKDGIQYFINNNVSFLEFSKGAFRKIIF